MQLRSLERLVLSAKGWPLAFDLYNASGPENGSQTVYRATYDHRVGNQLFYQLAIEIDGVTLHREITIQHPRF